MSTNRFKALCGYRISSEGNLTKFPNTSDAHDGQSVRLGAALFERLGVSTRKRAPNEISTLMTGSVLSALRAEELAISFSKDCELWQFEQYRHLGVVEAIKADHLRRAVAEMDRLEVMLESTTRAVRSRLAAIRLGLQDASEQRASIVRLLRDERYLRLDVAGHGRSPYGGSEDADEHIVVGLSLKWSLRTDRAQDCISQGQALAARRQGRMPHYAVVTMETRPAMLRILGQSPHVDVVYHLALNELVEVVDDYAKGRSKSVRAVATNLHSMVEAGQVRDFSDLLAYLGG